MPKSAKVAKSCPYTLFELADAVHNGILSVNEAREMMGLTPLSTEAAAEARPVTPEPETQPAREE